MTFSSVQEELEFFYVELQAKIRQYDGAYTEFDREMIGQDIAIIESNIERLVSGEKTWNANVDTACSNCTF